MVVAGTMLVPTAPALTAPVGGARAGSNSRCGGSRVVRAAAVGSLHRRRGAMAMQCAVPMPAVAGMSSARGKLVACRAGEQEGGSLLDEIEDRCPVPIDQRPASQLKECQESILLGWGGLELPGYLLRLSILSGFFYFVLAYPIASDTYNPQTQPLATAVSALVGTLGATSAISLVIYNGWSYTRDRLLSATVEYEETGWYDGQVYVKDPEMLARDRLLGMYTVRPIVERLRKTMLGCGVGVVASVIALNFIDAPTPKEYGDYGATGGFFSEASRDRYEPDAAEEEEDEAEALANYEASMAILARQKESGAAAMMAHTAPSVEAEAAVEEDAADVAM